MRRRRSTSDIKSTVWHRFRGRFGVWYWLRLFLASETIHLGINLFVRREDWHWIFSNSPSHWSVALVISMVWANVDFLTSLLSVIALCFDFNQDSDAPTEFPTALVFFGGLIFSALAVLSIRMYSLAERSEIGGRGLPLYATFTGPTLTVWIMTLACALASAQIVGKVFRQWLRNAG
jgi:hypothetical protein